MEKYLRASAIRRLAVLASVAAVVALAGCGGGGGSASAPEGTLQLALTDAPSCYEHVYVTVQKARVHSSGAAADADAGWHELTLATPKRIDLLNLTNGVLEELGSVPLPAGHYSQLRLVLADNDASNPLANAVQPVGGTLVALRTPSAQQSGLKLQVNVEVEAGKVADLVLDFDACKSVVKAGNSGNYNLKPVMSVTPRSGSSIQGWVTTTLSISATAVSAQQDGTIVRSTVPDASGKFTLAFIPPGTYTLVITSEGHATGVVTSIPVTTATGTISLNGTATAVVLPTSTMSTVAGSVTATTTSASGTATAAVTDATVTALQGLTGGPVIQLTSTPVDLDLGTYSFKLPAAAPVKAPYAASGLSFSPDTAVAGKYRLQVTAPGRSMLEKPADVGAGNATVNFAY